MRAAGARVVRNFSPGPGALPREVLMQAREAMLDLDGTGLSILGLSHRSTLFREMIDEAEDRIRSLLRLPADYHVLFLQGGGTLQFSMVPMTMLEPGGSADYVLAGYWSRRSVEAGRHHGTIRLAWDGTDTGFCRLPGLQDLDLDPKASYFHYVSNETVEGLQWNEVPQVSCPLVCDMSSDFLSRPFDVAPYSLIYAHAQKNIGPAGVTVVLVRDDVLARVPEGLPGILDYRVHCQAHSLFHTPPVFSIYVVLLVLRWLCEEIGGLEQMGRLNAEKASIVRGALAANESFYNQDVAPDWASAMNVTFRCPTPEQDASFVTGAEEAGLVGVGGHRSRGGLRISLYNGVTLEDARVVADYLGSFAGSQ